MLVVFFNYRGVVHYEFIFQSKTDNKEYYLAILRTKNSWTFQHNSAPSYFKTIASDFSVKHEARVIAQQPPDLTHFFCP